METNAKHPVIKRTLAFIFSQVSAQQKKQKRGVKKIWFECCCNQANENKWQLREGAPLAGERKMERSRKRERETNCFSTHLFMIIDKLYP